MRISAVWYPITNVAAARRFYGEVLNLREVHHDADSGLTAYDTEGGPPLFLVRREDRAGTPGGAVVTLAAGGAMGDLETLQARASQGGARMGDLQINPTVRILTLYDPDGNMLEVSEPVSQQA